MKVERPVLDSVLWLDIKSIPGRERAKVVSDLTVTSRYADDDDGPIRFWKCDGGWVGLPIAYGLKLAADLKLKVRDNREDGERVLFRRVPAPRSLKQKSFFETLHKAAMDRPATFAVAPTGTGKTVAALYSIAKLGRAALVIVPSRNLAAQWRDEAVRHLGIPESAVHIFSGGKCRWEGYRIVVAVVHNLCDRQWPDGFYNHFGTVVWDEGHRVGAKVFSQSIWLFPARHKIVLTATPNRKDGMTKLLTSAFGDPDTKVKGTSMVALECNAYVLNTKWPIKARNSNNRAAMVGMLISDVAAHENRNELIACVVMDGYDAGRNVLVLSDRIEQLKWLKDYMEIESIPASDIGLFIGSMSDKALNKVKAESRIILATYGMMKEGQDIPRMDMGIDATPRSEGIQAIGRIRREFPGKKIPIWVTLFDEKGSALLKGISGARIKDYVKCGVKVTNVGRRLTDIPF